MSKKSEQQKHKQEPECYLMLQDKIGYQFHDTYLLKSALTHRSFSANHNERLEFLGDAVLELAVSTWLYQDFPHLPEGELSRIRSNVVCKEVLAQIGHKLNLSPHLLLGFGELKSGGATKNSILANAVEAILGAVYLEFGLIESINLVKKWLNEYMNDSTRVKLKDSKTYLQECLQARKLPIPKYVLQKIDGNAHEQTFIVECIVETLNLSTIAQACTKKDAEQLAAKNMIEKVSQLSLCKPNTIEDNE
jgi:ribonuclease-3